MGVGAACHARSPRARFLIAGSWPLKSSNGDFGGESQLGRYCWALAGAQDSLWAKSMCVGEGERDDELLLLVSVMTCRRRERLRRRDFITNGEHEELDDGVDGFTTLGRGGERDDDGVDGFTTLGRGGERDDREERKRLRDRDRTPRE